MKRRKDEAILMSLSDSSAVRKFIAHAADYIDKEFDGFIISQHENDGTSSDSKSFTIYAEDMFFSVFKREDVDGKMVVTGWLDEDSESNGTDAEDSVPEEFAGKTWEEIFDIIKRAALGCIRQDSKDNFVVTMFEAMRRYVEFYGFYFYTFGGVKLDWISRKDGKIRIGFARKIKKK